MNHQTNKKMIEDCICEANSYKKPIMSVGEEFVAWAETYWKLNELFEGTCKDPSEKRGEVCPYSSVKPIFEKKINDLIQDRVMHYM